MVSDDQPQRTSPPRYMYHNFPRRAGADAERKAIEILSLIIEHGLLLTPEIERWVDEKTPPSPPEEYISVGRRCCFTELAEHELPKHAEYFGKFALEFEPRILCDLHAMPVFYVPRTSDSNGYGIGPALITQLAHVQEMLGRLTKFLEFARSVGNAHASAPVIAHPSADGGVAFTIAGTTSTLNIPRGMLEQAKKKNPSFRPPVLSPSGTQLGTTAGGLASILNTLTLGLHEPKVLTGTVQALASLFYSTERPDDPFLSHYRQREWRIISNMKRRDVDLSQRVSGELRKQLVELDRQFFERELQFPSGLKPLVDECHVFRGDSAGRMALSFARRVICPAIHRTEVESLLRDGGMNVPVATMEEIADHAPGGEPTTAASSARPPT
ncbi:hypothetical protein [Reyranella sp.]|uniref:hypothetical protein n=1 Tax=Reyranella sp. TaxID=1929291 RepID=UPI0027316B98|nr:hypothetical protein [Reyranella sp.]MDP2377826.1 hypothetical protein [Reyranella sp.]